MVLDALCTEGVQAVEGLGLSVELQADLTHQELVVNLLGQLRPS